MTPDPRLMSADGLANAIYSHMPDLAPDDARWVRAYVAELHRLARIAERPTFQRRAS